MFRRGGIYYRQVTPSIYGGAGAGGHGTRISVSSHLMNYGYDNNRGNLLLGNEKMTMQMNDRLANYLEKVRLLEEANIKYEEQIKHWYETKVPSPSRNDKHYDKQIEEIEALKNQIKEAHLERGRWILQVDNCRFTAQDYELKCETEREMRLTVESDICGLRKVIDELTLCKTDLEIQIEELNKDLLLLKKEHQEEVDNLRQQLGKTVNMELKTAPGLNISAIIDEMRRRYEALAEENLQKAKQEFQMQTETLQQKVTLNTQELKEFEAQIKELTRTYQEVDIELKSQLRMKDSLEHTPQTTNAHYNSKLTSIQAELNALQAQLTQIWMNAEHENQKYQELLGIKIRLEQEIDTYRYLLEGGRDIIIAESQLSTLEKREIKKIRMIKIVIEQRVDGKVVSSEV
ncbi:LOW QUALITY PROTEIN: keratin, type I cytoskeletal 20-like [Hipposideros larvatus]